MGFVKAFVFDHLSQAHLERLQRNHEALERELALQHRTDNGQPARLRDYWLMSDSEKKLLRYKMQ